jgi:uncharacterized protein
MLNALSVLFPAVFPDTQAIYRYGSHGTAEERADSDADIGLLFHPAAAKHRNAADLLETRMALEDTLKKEVDLVNLRRASTVFQKEVIMADRRIYTGDAYAADEFEMLVLSFYQKLNEERAEILEAGSADGRFYDI